MGVIKRTLVEIGGSFLVIVRRNDESTLGEKDIVLEGSENKTTPPMLANRQETRRSSYTLV